MIDTTVRDGLRDEWVIGQESAATGATYRFGIDRWFAWCDAQGVEVFAARRADVDRYRHALLNSVSRRTLAKNLSIISAFYRHVVQEGDTLLEHNPVQNVRRPKVARTSKREGLTAQEARTLRAASLERGPRTAALVHVLLGTAVRVSEAVGARTDALGWWDGDRVLHVVRKGGADARLVIQPADWAVLERYLATRAEVAERWLLATTGGRRMSRQTAYREIRELADSVVVRKRIGPHALRRTAATLALDAGQPIQEVQALLGHASSATTQLYDSELANRGRSASRALGAVYGA